MVDLFGRGARLPMKGYSAMTCNRLLRRGAAATIAMLTILGAGLVAAPPTTPAAPRQEGDQKKEQLIRGLRAQIEQAPPPALQALIEHERQTAPDSGIRLTPFVQRAVAEGIPAVAAPKAGAEPREVAEQLTEENARQALLATLRQLSGTRPPENLPQLIQQNKAPRVAAVRAVGAGAAPVPTPALTRFDWRERGWVFRDWGVVTRIQDQGRCGCCWAFASVGAYESAYLRANSMLPNVAVPQGSEQDVLNCYRAHFGQQYGLPWSCNGGWWAFDLFIQPGVADRRIVPYQGQQQNCAANAARPYLALSWRYIDPGNNPNSLPTTDALKQALCDHGPLVAAVFASTVTFGAHDGTGVIRDFRSGQNNQVDHAIMIIGWDNAREAWIIKNSWGTGWGAQGFGYVGFNYNNIGLGASYVEAASPQRPVSIEGVRTLEAKAGAMAPPGVTAPVGGDKEGPGAYLEPAPSGEPASKAEETGKKAEAPKRGAESKSESGRE
jgi:hypothetical protein